MAGPGLGTPGLIRARLPRFGRSASRRGAGGRDGHHGFLRDRDRTVVGLRPDGGHAASRGDGDRHRRGRTPALRAGAGAGAAIVGDAARSLARSPLVCWLSAAPPPSPSPAASTGLDSSTIPSAERSSVSMRRASANKCSRWASAVRVIERASWWASERINSASRRASSFASAAAFSAPMRTRAQCSCVEPLGMTASVSGVAPPAAPFPAAEPPPLAPSPVLPQPAIPVIARTTAPIAPIRCLLPVIRLPSRFPRARPARHYHGSTMSGCQP